MRPAPPSWVDPLMRAGYVARGIVYLMVGALAFLGAVDGGKTPDSQGALGTLLDKPFGKAMLMLITLGLLAYALWSTINGVLDLDDKGTTPSGWGARSAQLISGAIHCALAVSVAPLALGRGGGDGGDRTDHWTALLMQQPFGRWLVALVGCITIAIGVQHFVKAYHEKYKEHMRYTQATQRLAPLLKLGLAAHGLIVLLAGAFLIWAAWTADPTRAGGMGEALATVRAADAGHLLLATVGIGLVGFAIYCFIEAAFRIVPRCAPNDLQTLASKARTAIGS